jgi:hypothetical protein
MRLEGESAARTVDSVAEGRRQPLDSEAEEAFKGAHGGDRLLIRLCCFVTEKDKK